MNGLSRSGLILVLVLPMQACRTVNSISRSLGGSDEKRTSAPANNSLPANADRATKRQRQSELIKKGDGLRGQKKFGEALKAFEEANRVFPQESWRVDGRIRDTKRDKQRFEAMAAQKRRAAEAADTQAEKKKQALAKKQKADVLYASFKKLEVDAKTIPDLKAAIKTGGDAKALYVEALSAGRQVLGWKDYRLMDSHVSWIKQTTRRLQRDLDDKVKLAEQHAARGRNLAKELESLKEGWRKSISAKNYAKLANDFEYLAERIKRYGDPKLEVRVTPSRADLATHLLPVASAASQVAEKAERFLEARRHQFWVVFYSDDANRSAAEARLKVLDDKLCAVELAAAKKLAKASPGEAREHLKIILSVNDGHVEALALDKKLQAVLKETAASYVKTLHLQLEGQGYLAYVELCCADGTPVACNGRLTLMIAGSPTGLEPIPAWVACKLVFDLKKSDFKTVKTGVGNLVKERLVVILPRIPFEKLRFEGRLWTDRFARERVREVAFANQSELRAYVKFDAPGVAPIKFDAKLVPPK